MNSKKENKVLNEKLVPVGIWAPNAKILCHECHGNVFSRAKYNEEEHKFEDLIMNEEEFEKACLPKPLDKNRAVTRCNKCNKEIQVYDFVAHENNLCMKLQEKGINAFMSQTGGMNSAVEINTKDEGFIWITYDISGEDEWYLAFYDNEGDYLDKYFMTQDEKEILDYILNLDCLV